MATGLLKRREFLTVGDMIIYPYLWSWQDATDFNEELKRRPCVVAGKVNTDGGPTVFILPITTQPARDLSERLIVPFRERSLVGMDPGRAQSICIRDCNVDTNGPGSHIPKTITAWSFSPQFRRTIMREFADRCEKGLARIVKREPSELDLRAGRDCDISFA